MRSSFHQANFLSNICCWLGVTHNATQSWSGNVIYIFLFLFTLTQLPNWPKNTLDQIRTLKTQLLFRYPNGLYSTAAHYTQVYHIKCNLYKSVKIVCSLSAGGKVSGSCWKYISFFPARTNLCQSTCLRLSLFWGGGGQIFQSVVRYDAGGKQFFTFGSALPSSPTEESTSLKIQRTAITSMLWKYIFLAFPSINFWF